MNILKRYISKQTSESLLKKYKRIILTILCLSIILMFQIIDSSVNKYSIFIVLVMIIFIKNEIEKMIIIKELRSR